MSPDVVMRARAVAPDVLAELVGRGLGDLVVGADGPVWVESRVHEMPVPLHDVDDVRWFAADRALALEVAPA